MKSLPVPRFLVFFALLLIAGVPAVQSQSPPRIFGEAHVLRSMRQIHSAQMTYQATIGSGNYGSLENLGQAGFIDEALATGSKYGYVYAVSTATGPSTFVVNAIPRAYRKSGIRSFRIDAAGEVRGGDKNGQPATPSDPVIDDCTNGGVPDNERCTILDMRTLHSAQMTYNATAGNGNYGLLGQLFLAGLIRTGLQSGASRGYLYVVEVIDSVPNTQPASFKIWATPQSYPTSGVRSFYIDQNGILRGADKNGGRADENDPPINQ